MRTTVPHRSHRVVERLRAAGCVFAEAEADLLIGSARSDSELADLVERRVSGVPLEHLLGWAEFDGLRIAVEPGVFVPRRRSELAVREAATRARPESVVVDLCCGSGALAAAVARRRPDLEVYAADIDPRAVSCARRNLPADRVFLGDLYGALPRWLQGRIEVLVVNAPYVPTDAVALMPREARLYEPSQALDGGPDGLDLHRRLAAQATEWLRPDGVLIMETSRPQASATRRICEVHGFSVLVTRQQELDATVAVATRTDGRTAHRRGRPEAAPPAR